jgi:hypothetical protein
MDSTAWISCVVSSIAQITPADFYMCIHLNGIVYSEVINTQDYVWRFIQATATTIQYTPVFIQRGWYYYLYGDQEFKVRESVFSNFCKY